MKYSIIHISDIHKSDNVDYESLYQSLKRDLDAYTSHEGIVKPSFIVVSGDLIQGAYTDEEIIKQYSDVEEFLDKICKLYLDGNRKRCIVVPGNHDVNRRITKASVVLSSKPYNENLKEYFSQVSNLRWNWKDRNFYEINDAENYKKRFELFVSFYNHFYEGIRKYPINPECQAYTYTDEEFKVTFCGLNSCHKLDHLCDTGNIAEDALISVGEELNDSYNQGFLNIAIWHHHYYGRPLETNYMDRSILTDLLSNDVHIGLFGHQHHFQIAEEYSDMLLSKDDKVQKLLLVSSGTLFGTKKELAFGDHRQYNVIEVEHHNGCADIYINIREDKNPNPNNKIPHWAMKALPNSTNKIHYQVCLKEISPEKVLLQIDRKCKETGDYIAACESIKQLEADTNTSYNLFFKNYLKEVSDYEYVYDNIKEIHSVEDAVLKLVAASQLNDVDKKKALLEDPQLQAMDDMYVKTLLNALK